MARIHSTIITLLSIAATLGVSDGAAAADSTKARSALVAMNADDAKGECRVTFGSPLSRFDVRLANLTPNRTHTLHIDGRQQVDFTADSVGKARVRFASRAQRGHLAIAADPRGAWISVTERNREVIAGVCAGIGEAPKSVANLRAELEPTDRAPEGAEARVAFAIRKDGKRRFVVDVEGMPEGSYPLFVDGIERGYVLVDSEGNGRLGFGALAEGGYALDFDPRRQVIDLMNEGEVWFSGDLDGHIAGVNACKTAEATNPFAAEGEGSGRVILRTREDCARDLVVQIEGVASGEYGVRIDGADRGVVTVEGDSGYVRYTTKPSLPGDRFLDFPANGAAVEVLEAETVRFSAVQGAPSLFAAKPAGCTERPVEMRRPLLAKQKQGAWGRVTYIRGESCDARFALEMRSPVDGKVEVAVDGESQDYMAISDGVGELTVEGDLASSSLLGPIGRRVEVIEDGVTILERELSE
jgi:hypothetical protein